MRGRETDALARPTGVVNALTWLQQREAALQAWVGGHETGIQAGVSQHGAGLKTWVPDHPIEAVIIAVALILLLRLLPGPRRGE